MDDATDEEEDADLAGDAAEGKEPHDPDLEGEAGEHRPAPAEPIGDDADDGAGDDPHRAVGREDEPDEPEREPGLEPGDGEDRKHHPTGRIPTRSVPGVSAKSEYLAGERSGSASGRARVVAFRQLTLPSRGRR